MKKSKVFNQELLKEEPKNKTADMNIEGNIKFLWIEKKQLHTYFWIKNNKLKQACKKMTTWTYCINVNAKALYSWHKNENMMVRQQVRTTCEQMQNLTDHGNKIPGI